MKPLTLTALALALLTPLLPAAVPPGTYVGTSSTVVRYLNPDTLQTVSQETFSRKLLVFVGAPESASGTTESNPFTLSVRPKNSGAPLAPGQIFLESARVFPINGTPTLFQYWTLQNSTTGFNGALTNNYIESDLARDRVIANFGGPGGSPAKFKMHDARVAPGLQCSLDAIMEGDLMKLRIRGYAYIPGQAIIRFNTKVNAVKQAAPAPLSEPLE